MYSEPEVWFQLMDKLGDMVIAYLRAHMAAGGKAFQLFDSWVGALSPEDFPHICAADDRADFRRAVGFAAAENLFPGCRSGELLPTLSKLQADVIGLDWRVPIAEGRRRLGGDLRYRAIWTLIC